jgi:hypothetical protein
LSAVSARGTSTEHSELFRETLSPGPIIQAHGSCEGRSSYMSTGEALEVWDIWLRSQGPFTELKSH